MTLPSEHLLLRQPGKACEIVFVKNGVEVVLFSGGRWAARRTLAGLRNSIPYEGTPAYCRKVTGAIVPMLDRAI